MKLNGVLIEQYMINIFYKSILFPNNTITDCWEYNGSKDKDGYCHFSVKNKTRKAHRFSFVIHNPEIDIDGKIIMHTCDNRSCVNPHHLRVGTNRDNIDDMMNKNRQLKGSKNGHSILTENLVTNIIKDIILNNVKSVTDIMNSYELSRPHVHQILVGDIWKDITYEICNEYNLTLSQVKSMIVK